MASAAVSAGRVKSFQESFIDDFQGLENPEQYKEIKEIFEKSIASSKSRSFPLLNFYERQRSLEFSEEKPFCVDRILDLRPLIERNDKDTNEKIKIVIQRIFTCYIQNVQDQDQRKNSDKIVARDLIIALLNESLCREDTKVFEFIFKKEEPLFDSNKIYQNFDGKTVSSLLYEIATGLESLPNYAPSVKDQEEQGYTFSKWNFAQWKKGMNLLIKLGADLSIKSPDEYQETILHQIIRHFKYDSRSKPYSFLFDQVQYLVEEKGMDIQKKNPKGQTSLHVLQQVHWLQQKTPAQQQEFEEIEKYLTTFPPKESTQTKTNMNNGTATTRLGGKAKCEKTSRSFFSDSRILLYGIASICLILERILMLAIKGVAYMLSPIGMIFTILAMLIILFNLIMMLYYYNKSNT